MEKHIALKYCTDKPFAADLREWIYTAGQWWGLDKEMILHIQIAVDEACTNIVRHAYPNTSGKIRIELRPYREKIKAVIKDWGRSHKKAYRPASKPEKVIKNATTGGLGIFSINKLMDEVRYCRRKNHNELILIKKRKPKHV